MIYIHVKNNRYSTVINLYVNVLIMTQKINYFFYSKSRKYFTSVTIKNIRFEVKMYNNIYNCRLYIYI